MLVSTKWLVYSLNLLLYRPFEDVPIRGSRDVEVGSQKKRLSFSLVLPLLLSCRVMRNRLPALYFVFILFFFVYQLLLYFGVL